MGKLKNHMRMLVQLAFAALTNGYAAGFAQGNIYKGAGKFVCVPGLNCYSCPGALGACPIGSLQAVITSREHKFSFYVIGFLLLFGALFGRLVCGWLCPFGLVQDLLHKGQPWFCKYICPSGTLFAGIPLIAANPPLRAALGWLFTWKAAILVVLVMLSIIVYRPFCRYLCPLGAIYGLFNPVALYRFRINEDTCTKCGACQKACKLDIPVYRTPNSPECIRCGDCRRACPHGAVCNAGAKPTQASAKR